MDKKQLATLINTGVMRTGTKISVLRKGMDLGASPNVVVSEILEIISYKKVKGEMVLEAFRLYDSRKYVVRAEHIRFIDGMPIERLISAHKSEGKKRGRKSKKR